PVRDARRLADQLAEERLERLLDRRRHLLDIGELVEDRDVAESAEEDAAVGQLLPVVEALPRVMRAVIEHAVDRLADDDLSARRPDRGGKPGDEPVTLAVGAEGHLV